MQAKNVIDPLSATDEDAILYRSVEWGRSGEKFGVGYYYPTTPDQEIQHIVTVGEQVNIKLFLKSGGVRTTTINGTTEWNVTITPAVGYDLVTYAYTGIGADPGLSSVNSGDYVSVINTGEFIDTNQGAYKVDSATTTSFTIRRATGEAEEQNNVASLETNTISFFEPADTTAQEIVEYVGLNLTDHITATLVDDNGISGAGIINRSTSEDSNFAYEYIYFKDGKNYLLSSDITATAPSAQFVFKNPLELPTFSTNTVDAYSFNNGENMQKIKFGKYTIDHNGIREESWSDRDRLPTKDPSGDVDDPMESHRLDALRYMSQMQKSVLKPEGKYFGYSKEQVLEFEEYMNKTELKCNCGTFAVYGKVPARSHAHYCDLRKNLSV